MPYYKTTIPGDTRLKVREMERDTVANVSTHTNRKKKQKCEEKKEHGANGTYEYGWHIPNGKRFTVNC